MVGHRLKSNQYDSMAARTAPGRTYGHLIPLLASIVCNAHAFCSSLFSTHLAYNFHCSVLWFVVTAPLAIAVYSCACAYFPLQGHLSYIIWLYCT